MKDHPDQEGAEGTDVTEGKGVIDPKELIGLKEPTEKGPRELIEMTELKGQEGTEMRVEEIARTEETAGKGGISLPGDRILLTEEKATGVSEEKETKKGKTDPGDTEMIETNEESTRTVMMNLFRRAGGKEKYPRAFKRKRPAKKQRSGPLS